MPVCFPDLHQRARAQRTLQPRIYGNVDFDRTPYRFTADAGDRSALPAWVAERTPLLADDRLVVKLSLHDLFASLETSEV